MGRRHEQDEGFTLIELLVVIIIIGILASIAIPTFLGQRQRANESAMKADLRNMAAAAETFWGDYGTYAGFEASPGFTDAKRTRNVTVDVIYETIRGYCAEATHAAVADVWSFDSLGSTQMSQNPCPAPPP